MDKFNTKPKNQVIMIELPTVKIKPRTQDPKLLTLFGQSKVGKTTKLTELDNCLIIDTEKGSDYVEGMIVQVNSLAELRQVPMAIANSKHRYNFGAIDVIDKVVEWMEKEVIQEYNLQQKEKGLTLKASDISDIPYGGGYTLVRMKVMKMISAFRHVFPRLIIIGHRKKTIIGETSVEFTSSSLDLTGKLKNLICGDSDAIGYVFRDDENKLKVSFQGSDELEVGSRSLHLRGKVIEFDWHNIYIDKF